MFYPCMEMAMKTLVWTCFLLNFLPYSTGKAVRDLSPDEFQNLAKSTSKNFVAVYFDHKDARQKYPSFFKEYRKACDHLDAYGIQLARIDCDSASIPECQQLTVLTYRDGELEESVSLDTLFNVDSIMAHLLQILLKYEITYLYDKPSADQLITESKGSKDVLFAYVKGFGSKAHRAIVEAAFVYSNQLAFALTTDADVAKGIIPNFSEDKIAAVVGFNCKKLDLLYTGPCDSALFRGQYKPYFIGRFSKLIQLPRLVELGADGRTVYERVNQLYVFSDLTKEEPFTLKDADTLATRLYGTAGVVFVDVNKHPKTADKFGLSEDTLYPTAAFISSESTDSEVFAELFPENQLEFDVLNVQQFVEELVDNPQKAYSRIASSTSLRTHSLAELERGMSSEISSFIMDFVLVGMCEHDNPEARCSVFFKNLRRLSRTIDRHVTRGITPVYVPLNAEDIAKFGSKKEIPTLRLYNRHKGAYAPNSDWKDSLPSYKEMLGFIKMNTGIMYPQLPPSNSDEIPYLTENSLELSPEEDGQPSSEESWDESQKEDDGSVPAEETEDDEVAGAVWYTAPPHVPEDKVPSLTDKTFQPERDLHDLLVVNFFQPWDPRSKAIIGPYVDAALNLGKIDVGNFNVRLARVNCFDWTDVCQDNNITVYPTIKLFRKGADELIYGGPLDADHLVKAVILLQQPSPIRLSEDDIDPFLKGDIPKNAAKATSIAVLGVFESESSSEFKAFSNAARSLRGDYLLGYVSGEAAKKSAASYGLETPGILAIKRNDPLVPRVAFYQPFTEANIVKFVEISNLQTYGELTPINLPLYNKHRRPLLVVFRQNMAPDDKYTPVMEKIAADTSLPNVFLCWMALSRNDVNGAILESYTGKMDVPVLVLVDHSKSAVYQYRREAGAKEVIEWTNRCLDDKNRPSHKLKESKWEPLLEGYDYLKLIDEEEALKNRKEEQKAEEKTSDNGEESEDFKKSERFRQRKPEDFRHKDGNVHSPVHEHEHDEL